MTTSISEKELEQKLDAKIETYVKSFNTTFDTKVEQASNRMTKFMEVDGIHTLDFVDGYVIYKCNAAKEHKFTGCLVIRGDGIFCMDQSIYENIEDINSLSLCTLEEGRKFCTKFSKPETINDDKDFFTTFQTKTCPTNNVINTISKCICEYFSKCKITFDVHFHESRYGNVIVLTFEKEIC